MYFGCHGIPERCFSYKGKSMLFCARCLGASLGHIGAFVLFVSGSSPGIFLASALIFIMGVDWSLQKWLGIMSTNPRRLVTGISGGLGVGVFLWTGIKEGYLLLISVLYN
jgi:uncharacterized membrane protein